MVTFNVFYREKISVLKAVELESIRGDRRLFSGLNLTVNEGDLLFVQGRNGSGKTTLLRMLCGLGVPAAGSIYWQGKKIRSLGEEFLNKLTFIGHLNGVKDQMTPIESLLATCKLSGQAITHAKALEALAQMGLEGFEDLPSKYLSQGQKRRTALARLLVSQATLWVLDEPLVSLDVAAVGVVQQAMSEHLATGGSIVLTTHQPFAVTAGKSATLDMSTLVVSPLQTEAQT